MTVYSRLAIQPPSTTRVIALLEMLPSTVRTSSVAQFLYPARLSTKFQGWRGSTMLFCWASWSLFTFNFICTTVVAGKFTSQSGTSTILVGPCDDIGTADTWTHLGMNVMSALLLAAAVRHLHTCSINPKCILTNGQ